jgi:tetratricopeptide (TPR) repeat protein
MAKKKQKPKRAARPAPPSLSPPPSRSAIRLLEEAEDLIEDGDLPEARDVLEALARQRPRDPDVLTLLVNVNFDLHDLQGYQTAAERLLRVTPNDAELTLGLAGAYLSNLYPALALRTFRRALERWPDHERAAEIRAQIADLEAMMPGFLEELGVPGDEGFDLAVHHEEVRALLEQGSYPEARRAAEQLLRRWPDFAPALNNLSQIHAQEGHVDLAIATARRVLDSQPDNVQALSNLTRILLLSGRLDEARAMAERLKAVDSDRADVGLKKAEALSYLGDDQGVLDAFAADQRMLADGGFEDLADPTLFHLAAVAHLRLGHETDARLLWERALRKAPGFTLAENNLDELHDPVGERHAPWPFPFGNWLSRQTIGDLTAAVATGAERGDEEVINRGLRRFLRQHPEFTALVPLLLDRGDPEGREFALRVAALLRTPELLAALRDFALGQRGPDAMRQEAAQVAREAGLMPAGSTRFWSQGEWRDVIALSFEIHEEPLHRHPPQVEEWHGEALEALNAGDGKRGEQLLRQALEVQPDDPSLLNNLASAYELQGRSDEAQAIVRRLFDAHPDYFFARIGIVRQAARERQIERAKALLQPLVEQERYHISEFRALCQTQAELHLAEGNRDAARSWIDLWASVDPDHPGIAQWRRRLSPPGWLGRVFGGRGSPPTA